MPDTAEPLDDELLDEEDDELLDEELLLEVELLEDELLDEELLDDELLEADDPEELALPDGPPQPVAPTNRRTARSRDLKTQLLII